MTREAGAMDHRARLTAGIVLLGLALLVGRAGYLQVVLGDEFARRARAQHLDTIEEPAPRGRILDRHGRVLAASYHARSLGVNLPLVRDPDLFAARAAFAMGDPSRARELADTIRRKGAEGKRFIFLARRLDREIGDALERAQREGGAGDLDGMELREEPRRFLPQGRAGAAVIGMLGEDGEGLSGLERRFDRELRGTPGRKVVLRDGGRRIVDVYPELGVSPARGPDLYTTLDVAIQQVAEAALDEMEASFSPERACAVVLDPKNGEVLALAGRPALDPAAFPGVPPQALAIPAIHLPFEPGSTLKPVLLAAALAEGAVRTDTVVDCGQGAMRFGGRILHDVHAFGPLALRDVLVKSSNIGMAQVGRALGIRRAHDALRAAGFGARTGVELPGENEGSLTPLARWHEDYTLVSVSMGHEIVVTPLQLARALAAIVNGGDLFAPALRLDGPRPPPVHLDAAARSRSFVVEAMVGVVEEGTGRKAGVAGVRVGGKSGTAAGYPKGSGKYVCSFVAFAPADEPRLLALVVAYEPRKPGGGVPYAATVAAPAAGRILREALALLGIESNEAPPESGVRHVRNG